MGMVQSLTLIFIRSNLLSTDKWKKRWREKVAVWYASESRCEVWNGAGKIVNIISEFRAESSRN